MRKYTEQAVSRSAGIVLMSRAGSRRQRAKDEARDACKSPHSGLSLPRIAPSQSGGQSNGPNGRVGVFQLNCPAAASVGSFVVLAAAEEGERAGGGGGSWHRSWRRSWRRSAKEGGADAAEAEAGDDDEGSAAVDPFRPARPVSTFVRHPLAGQAPHPYQERSAAAMSLRRAQDPFGVWFIVEAGAHLVLLS
ncbi:hypothetical protein CDD83_3680 [Cordyceps sp. RAO-2017]|nr:hypothetical protein CDD83_3680 [Cordyceps sp. RAO-2017]